MSVFTGGRGGVGFSFENEELVIAAAAGLDEEFFGDVQSLAAEFGSLGFPAGEEDEAAFLDAFERGHARHVASGFPFFDRAEAFQRIEGQTGQMRERAELLQSAGGGGFLHDGSMAPAPPCRGYHAEDEQTGHRYEMFRKMYACAADDEAQYS